MVKTQQKHCKYMKLKLLFQELFVEKKPRVNTF